MDRVRPVRETWLRTAFAMAWAITIVTRFAASWVGGPLPAMRSGDLESPVLAAELARSTGALDLVVQSTPSMRSSLAVAFTMDDAFIAVYAVLFCLLGWELRRRGRRWSGRVVFGAMGDWEVLRTIGGSAGSPRTPSIVKWSLLFACMALATPAFLDRSVPSARRALGLMAAGLCALASAIGLGGVVLDADPMIESASGLMVWGLAVGAVYMLTHRFLDTGLCPALDRLASWPLARSFVNWESDGFDDVWLFLPSPLENDDRLEAYLSGAAKRLDGNVHANRNDLPTGAIRVEQNQPADRKDDSTTIPGVLYELPHELVNDGGGAISALRRLANDEARADCVLASGISIVWEGRSVVACVYVTTDRQAAAPAAPPSVVLEESNETSPKPD
jgi:hypothetical protein